MTVPVGADGRGRFAPDSFVPAGRHRHAGAGRRRAHRRPRSQPSGPGGADRRAASKTDDSGDPSEETFDVTGEEDYYRNPHRDIEMTGSFTVG